MRNLASIRRMAAAIALAGACSPASADFKYTDFSSINGLTLVGSAAQQLNSINLAPVSQQTAGGVWYTEAKQNVALGFQASMTIRVPLKNSAGADGFAFVIQNWSPNAIGGNGGALGYAANPLASIPGIPNSFAVEFDMWNNAFNWSDPSSSHISLQTRGTDENSADHTFSLGQVDCPDLSDAEYHLIRIVYSPGTMSVYLHDDLIPILEKPVNVALLLNLDNNGQAWIGVTASTGALGNSQIHELSTLEYTGVIPAPGATALLALGGFVLLSRRNR